MSEMKQDCAENREKVLVTGASGFIGSHLTAALIKKGYEVTALLPPSDDTRWIKNLNATVFYGDVTDKASLFKAVQGVTSIYHLAAVLESPRSERFYHTNYQGTKNLVEVCLDSKIELKRFLFVSSVAALGPSKENELLDEEAPCFPATDYGRSKLLCEQYVRSKKRQMPVTILRLPMVYGPRCFRGLFFIFKVLNKGIRISIGNGEMNLGFVEDIVEGIVKASKSPFTIGKTYHLGDTIYTANEILNAIEKALEKKQVRLRFPFPLLRLAVFFSELFAGITGTESILSPYLKYRYWRLDVSKAEKEFGFKAKTSLESGAKITADWYKRKGFI